MSPQKLYDLGISIIPIQYRSKKPHTKYLPNGSWKEYQQSQPCIERMEEWLADPLCNLAVVLMNGLIIVDFDSIWAHDLWLETFGKAGYEATYKVRTGRGYHYYYFCDESPERTIKWRGGEIKSSGYCLIPPSTHPAGRRYEAIVPEQPILRISNISEIFPEEISHQARIPLVVSVGSSQARDIEKIKKEVSLLRFFKNPKPSNNGFYTVHCALHDDSHRSAWISSRNRYGCHACITGSLSVVDFYMQLTGCNLETAVLELGVML